jgi:hypothetical protein
MLPPDATTPLIEAYLKDVDRTLLRENLKLTIEGRLQQMERFMVTLNEVHGLGLPPVLRRQVRERLT